VDDSRIIVLVGSVLADLSVAANALNEKHILVTVPSGKELFKFLEGTIPDLVLLDMKMFETNGYDVIRKLKDSNQTAGIPVIFITAATDPESEEKALSLGAVDYITRPFSPQLLLKRIESQLLIEEQKRELEKYSASLGAAVGANTWTVVEFQNAILKTVANLIG
jgi:putative two-component system response regulator